MLHELKTIISHARALQRKGLKSILATVVDLDGSSYRKPGVRMLITEDGQMIGAVSGGCVERDVFQQAGSVFKEGIPKVMTYDGRYRLGCEGLLYILIEPLEVSDAFYEAFMTNIETRADLQMTTAFEKRETTAAAYGTQVVFNKAEVFGLRKAYRPAVDNRLKIFSQTLKPCFRLFIFGGEHDAIKLCAMASLLGWEVQVICSETNPKTLRDFPGATAVTAQVPELMDLSIDGDTAVVLMNHNYVRDLKYVLQLERLRPRYIGILGSRKRREKLIDDLFKHKPDFDLDMLDHIYSPAGLHIGSVTPEEIALAILSEILAVYRGITPESLRNRSASKIKK